MARFWVYENWTHKRARVHRAECGMCNDGRGTQAGASERNGRWHAAASREEALALARRLGQPDTKECPFCAR